MRIWGIVIEGYASGLHEVLEYWTVEDCLDCLDAMQVKADIAYIQHKAAMSKGKQ